MSKTGNNKLTFLVIFKLTFLVKIILTILCDHINNETELKNEVAFIPVDKQECHNERILIIKGGIKIELDSNTPYSSVEPLLKSLL